VVMDKCHGDPKMKGVDQEINSGYLMLMAKKINGNWSGRVFSKK
jgi:hypothetical protein